MSNIFSKTFRKITGAQQKEEKLEELKKICEEYIRNRRQLLDNAKSLFEKRKKYCEDIRSIAEKTKAIENRPKWFNDSIKDSMGRMEDFEQAVYYEKNPEKFVEETDKTGRTAAYFGAAAATGATLATFGPTAAMSIATVLGTASTGTAISALSGVAATNAALAWLGGGAIAAGGAGVAGGSLVLAMFGPIGAAIAGVSTVSGIAFIRSKNRKSTEDASKNIENISHDNKNLAKKIVHLKQIIQKSNSNKVNRLEPTLLWISNVEPKDYLLWDDDQKHELEKLSNTVSNTVQLINERI